MRLAILLVLLCAGTASASTFYVGRGVAGASDAHGCTNNSSDICLTITHGVNVAQGAANILVVLSGTYTENVTVNSGGTGNLTRFVVEGYAVGNSCPETPSSDPFTPEGTNPSPTVAIVGQVQINAGNVTFTCFEVTPNYALSRNYNFNSFLPTDAGIGISTVGLANITISENFIHKNTGGSGGGYSEADPTGSGFYVFNHGIAAGCTGCGYNLTNISLIHNFVKLGGAQSVDISCAGTCLEQDNEVYGCEASSFTFSIGCEYLDVENGSGVGGGITSILHNYWHGANMMLFCNSGYPTCHVDDIDTQGGNAQNILVDRNVGFNQNEAMYFWQCETDPCDTVGPHTQYGTYQAVFNVVITNNIMAFGPGDPFDVCMDFWHAQAKFDNNICWGTYSEASLNSDIQSYQNNINVATYRGPGGSGQCTTPWGPNLQGSIMSDGTTFDTAGNNIDYNDTSCTIPHSGPYANDQVNTNPLWVLAQTYSNVPGANNSNYHLTSSSPAIGAGACLYSLFTDDLDGNLRPNCTVSGAFDVGPYQYQTSNPQPGPVSAPTIISVVENWAIPIYPLLP